MDRESGTRKTPSILPDLPLPMSWRSPSVFRTPPLTERSVPGQDNVGPGRLLSPDVLATPYTSKPRRPVLFSENCTEDMLDMLFSADKPSYTVQLSPIRSPESSRSPAVLRNSAPEWECGTADALTEPLFAAQSPSVSTSPAQLFKTPRTAARNVRFEDVSTEEEAPAVAYTTPKTPLRIKRRPRTPHSILSPVLVPITPAYQFLTARRSSSVDDAENVDLAQSPAVLWPAGEPTTPTQWLQRAVCSEGGVIITKSEAHVPLLTEMLRQQAAMRAWARNDVMPTLLIVPTYAAAFLRLKKVSHGCLGLWCVRLLVVIACRGRVAAWRSQLTKPAAGGGSVSVLCHAGPKRSKWLVRGPRGCVDRATRSAQYPAPLLRLLAADVVITTLAALRAEEWTPHVVSARTNTTAAAATTTAAAAARGSSGLGEDNSQAWVDENERAPVQVKQEPGCPSAHFLCSWLEPRPHNQGEGDRLSCLHQVKWRGVILEEGHAAAKPSCKSAR